MSLVRECAGIYFKDYQVSLGDAAHEALTACPSHLEALLHFGDDAIPRHICPLCLKALLMEGEQREMCPCLSCCISQSSISLTAALKGSGGLCLV